MTAPEIIHNLVTSFRELREQYTSVHYKETQLRNEFLNPFFIALGWDVYNERNVALQYRDVIHEDSLEIEGKTRAPDYAFCVGSSRKFFVEAKKPSARVKTNAEAAYQLRRYAWNTKLPLSILTDFEHFAVYDCRTRPDPKDSAAVGRVKLYNFEEYLSHWDEISSIFSREAVWKGKLDDFADGTKGKRSTTEVDAEFLKDIEAWRDLLARNIALRNFRSSEELANLPRAERQLNYAVQATIDRILFLRICEDREIEPPDQLLQNAQQPDVYANLLQLFKRADQKYNSGLFHFSEEKSQTSAPDTFTPTLQIDDKVLRQIIESLYGPSSYIFKEIPVEILGQIYEQFLGKVIRLTPKGIAKVEEKPEVRKAGGVYYTPSYIVDYIVHNTLSPLLNPNQPTQDTSSGSANSTPSSAKPMDLHDKTPSSEAQGLLASWVKFPGGGKGAACVLGSVPRSGSFDLSSRGSQFGDRGDLPFQPSANQTPDNQLESSSQTPSREGGRGVGLENKPTTQTISSEATEAVGRVALVNPTSTSLTPDQALKLRVVDPACGSGSFLLGAYQYLLNWHLNYYLTHDPESHIRGKNPPIVATEGGEYRLTTEEKKRILTASIYGVDIDAQAVEVTKLSLLLKLLEGETGQLTLGFDRVLPDLGNNIRCGNSLIGWDYFASQLLPDEEEIIRVNPFEWQRSFPEVFAQGGFDAVIGNPPYVRQEDLGADKRYYQSLYEVYTGTADLYSYFIERGIKLLAPNGNFSYIVANKWMRANYGRPLREWLKKQCIDEITDFGDLRVFTSATTYPCILRVSNREPHNRPWVTTVKTLDFPSLQEYVDQNGSVADQTRFEDGGWSLAGIETQRLMEKIRQNSIPLGEYVKGKIYYGIKTGLNEAFVIDQATRDRLIAEDPKSAELILPYAFGRDIKRYEPVEKRMFLIFMPKGWTNKRVKKAPWKWLQNEYPAIAAHLAPFEQKAIKRTDKGDYWWELRACAYYDEFEKPKIVYTEIALIGQFTLLKETPFFVDASSYLIQTDSKYLLGVLNSKLFTFAFNQVSSTIRGNYLRWKRQYMLPMPIHVIDESSDFERDCRDKIESLVEQIYTLNEYQPTSRKMAEFQNLKSIQLQNEIDEVVYRLYKLTAEEVTLVETNN